MTKRLPPFAKRLFEIQQRGYRILDTVNVYIGIDSWAKARAMSVTFPLRTLSIPAWLAPELYHWPVNQCDVMICDTSYAEMDYITDLVACLYKDGADVVRYMNLHDFKLFKVFNKDSYEAI